MAFNFNAIKERKRVLVMFSTLTNFLDVWRDFLLDLLVSGLVVGRLGGVHFVDAYDQLFHSEGEGQECMLASLPVLADTGFEFSGTRGYDQHGTVSLRETMFKLALSTEKCRVGMP